MPPDSHSYSWREVEAIFDEAIELDAEARHALLEQRCAGNEALRREVEELLRAADAPGPLDRAASELTPSLAEEASEALDARSYAAGQTVGPWRIEAPLGSGGMGRVFVATRADGAFEQRAALKILRWEIADSSLADRFARERQILASLEHPGIARLIDGGVSEDGLPYLATEFVDGSTITDWCDTKDLGLRERLQLFLDVCEAVEFAHRNLIVHRDLKASNILVDHDGRVKLLDFGVAKIVDETRDDEVTGTQLAPATIAVAAPEQLSGGRISTAADVWALGVLLYELLSGARPFGSGSASPAETMRQILGEEPSSPSARDGAHARALRGDLDNIVLLALRKDPAARYESVAALAEDVRRHRSGLPVRARGDALAYRAGKYIRRHAASLIFVSVTVVAIAALVGFYTARLATERDRARVQAETTERVKSFVLSMFEDNDPTYGGGRELSARDVLDAGARRIADELGEEPAIRAEMHRTVGGLYESLGAYDEADHHLSTAVELMRQVHGARSEPVAEALGRWGFVLGELDRIDEAVEVLQEAAEIRRELGDEEAVASTLNQLGMMLSYRGEYEEAERLLREALDTKVRLYGEIDASVAVTMSNLGLTLKWSGNAAAAEPLYRRALEIRAETVGKDSPDYCVSLDNLGVLLGQRGEYEESERCFLEALETRRRVLGESHPDVALNLNNLATLYRVQGRLDKAEPIYREVLALNEEIHGPEHRHVATNLTNLGSVLVTREEYDEAVEMFERALAIRRASLGEEHIDVAQTLGHLVDARMAQGRYEEAVELVEEAVSIARAAVGAKHPTLAGLLRDHGELLLELDQPAQAEAPLREALAIQQEVLVSGHWETLSTTATLGDCLGRLGQDEEALRQLESAFAGLAESRGPDDALTQRTRVRLYEFHVARGDAVEAARYQPDS